MLRTNPCCGTAAAGTPVGTGMLCQQGLRLKPRSYFWSAVDRAAAAEQTAPDLPAGIPGESGLQAQQLPEAAMCCDTVSSKSPSPAPAAALPGTISPSPTRRTRKPILFVDPRRLDGSIRPRYAALLMKLLRIIKLEQYLL